MSMEKSGQKNYLSKEWRANEAKGGAMGRRMEGQAIGSKIEASGG